MIDISKLKIGDKVCYQPSHYGEDELENGMVKEIQDNIIDYVWVVYNCDSVWTNYAEYTGALTDIRDLRLGWKH